MKNFKTIPERQAYAMIYCQLVKAFQQANTDVERRQIKEQLDEVHERLQVATKE